MASENIQNTIDARVVVNGIIEFLKIFLAPTYAVRLVGLILLAVGQTPEQTSQLTGVTKRTVRNWRRLLSLVVVSSDIHGMLRRPRVDLGTKTAGLEAEILEELNRGNYHTRRQIADMIQDRFGITLSLSSVSRLLRRLGLKRLKVGSLPAKADPRMQHTFYNDVMKPLIGKARKGLLALYYGDAAHFVHGCDFLGYLWCLARRLVKTFSGRSRYNVIGAVDCITHKMITVTNTTYITATTVCELLEQVVAGAKARGLTTVRLILDNARYQKCKLVAEKVAQLNQTEGVDLAIVYLPPYSPNLNLIERIWKLIKSELRTRYYDNFADFRQRIDDIIEGLSTTYKDQVANLMGKPHLYDNIKQISDTTYEILPPAESVA